MLIGEAAGGQRECGDPVGERDLWGESVRDWFTARDHLVNSDRPDKHGSSLGTAGAGLLIRGYNRLLGTMPPFVVSGRGSDGKQVTEEISAASGDAAVSLFESRGYTEVRLHSHEWFETMEWERIRKARRLPAEIPPADRTRFGTMSPREFLRYLLSQQFTRPLFVVPVVFLVVHLMAGSPWGLVDSVALGLLILPFAHALYLGLVGSSVSYHRIQEADAWGAVAGGA